MTGSVAVDGIGHPEHHRTPNINDGILHTKVETRLTAKRQRITAVLDGALHPHHAPGGNRLGKAFSGRSPLYRSNDSTNQTFRVSSSRTAIARSYKAFASSCELPTAVIPVLPSSPRAL